MTAKKEQRVVESERPHLAIVSTEIFNEAQRKLAKLHEIYGRQEGQLCRGTKVHYTQVYPTMLLGGLIYCEFCGARMHIGAKGRESRRMYCPNHRIGTCARSVLVPLEMAEQKMGALLGEMLESYPAWVQTAVARMGAALVQADAQMPAEL